MELIRNLKIESVSRLFPTPPRSLHRNQTVAEALKLMREEQVGCILVIQDEVLVGIFTERDLLKRVLASKASLQTSIQNVMTSSPVVVQNTEPIRLAIEKMQDGGYRHLPVVDTSHRPVGVLSAKHVIRYLVEHFPGTIYNQPPDPNQVPDHPEGA